MRNIFCTCLVLTLASLQPAETMITSIEKIQQFAFEKNAIIGDVIEKVIQSNTFELNKVKHLIKLQAEHSEATVSFAENIKFEHPNEIYLLIKQSVSSLTGDMDIYTAISEHLKSSNISLPSDEDLTGARASLIRIQRVYGLKAHDMFYGNYSGYIGCSLNTHDSYMLGKDAYLLGYPYEAIEWLKLTVDKLTCPVGKVTGDPQTLQIRRVEALSLLGRAYFYTYQIHKAKDMLKMCKMSGVTGIGDVIALKQELKLKNPGPTRANYKLSDKPMDANVSALCTRPKDQRVAVVLPLHICRFKRDMHIPYLRYKEEIMSLSPFVSLYHGIMFDSEVDYFKARVREQLIRGKVVMGANQQTASKDRTGELAWLDDTDTIAHRMSRRISSATWLNVHNVGHDKTRSSESFQILNYGLGGHYDVHVDAMLPSYVDTNMIPSGNRLATVLLYLSDVEKGGNTIFPLAGISVSPVKGMALLWYGYEPDMRHRDRMTAHAGCPVVIGNKWIANKWIWTNGNMFRRPCGPTPNTRHMEIEQLVSSYT